MINRTNWKLVREYLRFRKEVDQLAEKSLRVEEVRLRHILEWAGEDSFIKVSMIRPTLPEYVLTARLDGDETLSPVYIRKLIRTAYNFFKWLSTNQSGYRVIKKAWLDTLKPPRMTIEYKEHEAVTLDEVRKISQSPVYTTRDRRIRAAAVFWFLSGIRVGAFVTLPLSAVEIEMRTVKQWPKLGVHTKFGKHATTYLLNIPDLLEVVREWDQEVRSILPEDGLWFAPGLPDTGEIDPFNTVAGNNSDRRARKDLKEWLEKVGLPYYSPHKFRHGHAVYALKLAKDIAELKAVSQNLMHANISTTDGVYGMLSENDVREQIGSLGQRIAQGDNQDISTLIDLVRKLEERLKER